MSIQLYETVRLLKGLITSMFSKRVILVAEPTHPNLGDQAQLMCTERWIGKTFPNRSIVHLGMLFTPFDNSMKNHVMGYPVIKILLLKLFIRKTDIFIGHSGYYFVDHHQGWFAYLSILEKFCNRLIILPQTINFHTPLVKQRVMRVFSNRSNLLLLCRDEVSYKKAQEMFQNTKILLYPDIVTSLIGNRAYNKKREGILFCMRDDIEAFYKPQDIDDLMKKFGGIRMEKIDTTISASPKEMQKCRDALIGDMIEKISTYKVVITDRYHGTIFSAIASTPVIVINSADHKLSSGVKWFPKDVFGDAVQFAHSLDDAYSKIMEILYTNKSYNNPQYFKIEYWDKLGKLLDGQL